LFFRDQQFSNENRDLRNRLALVQQQTTEDKTLMIGLQLSNEELSKKANDLTDLAENLESLAMIQSVDHIVVVYKTTGGGTFVPTMPIPDVVVPPGRPDTQPCAAEYVYSDFRIDITGRPLEQKIVYDLHQQFEIVEVQGKNEEGQTVFLTQVFELNGESRVEELKISKRSAASLDESDRKFRWWNPHLELGIQGQVLGDVDIGPQLTFSALSYGRSKVENDLRFLSLGASVLNDSIAPTLIPIEVNVSRNLPLVTDIWLGPSVNYDKGIGLGISLNTTL